MKPGDILFRQGAKAKSVFLIEEGELRMARHLASGEILLLHKGLAGELFAEGALFASTYHCDGFAPVAATVAICAKADLLAEMGHSPDLGLELLQRVIGQLHRARALLELRNIKSAQDRVLQHIRLNDGLGAAAGSGPLLENAAELGLSRETYYRALAALARGGAITRDGRRIALVASRNPMKDRS